VSESPIAEFDLAIRSRIDIAAAPERLWPHLARLQDWKTSVVSVERLAGEPDAEGETLRIGQRPVDVTVYTIMRTVRSVAPHWKIQTLRTEDGLMTDGYVSYSLEPEGSATRLRCDVIARCRIALPDGFDAVEDFARLANESTLAKLDADHAALKRLVEAAQA
jgi:hypothetical protein